MKKLWIKVTKDKYELPLAVADSAAELSYMTGAKVQDIHSAVCNWKAGRKKFSSYVCVEVEDKDGEDY